MLAYLLDTNVCIRILRARPAHLLARLRDAAPQIATSTVVLAELLHGAARSIRPERGRDEVRALIAPLTILPFDDAAANHAGDIMLELGRSGRPIGHYDVLIAAHARSRGLIVVTTDINFQRVDGLRCEDWLAAA